VSPITPSTLYSYSLPTPLPFPLETKPQYILRAEASLARWTVIPGKEGYSVSRFQRKEEIDFKGRAIGTTIGPRTEADEKFARLTQERENYLRLSQDKEFLKQYEKGTYVKIWKGRVVGSGSTWQEAAWKAWEEIGANAEEAFLQRVGDPVRELRVSITVGLPRRFLGGKHPEG